MNRHHYDIEHFLYDQAKDAVTDIRTKLIDEAWFGRPAHSPSRSDHPSLGWDRTEGQQADGDKNPFESRWSEQDQARSKGDPEHAQELDFGR